MPDERYGELAMTADELDDFVWDGECFFVTIAVDHAGVARLRRDPRVSLSLSSHPAFPTKFVVVEGIAEEIADPDGSVSKRILFRKSAELFARMGIDRDRYFAEWI